MNKIELMGRLVKDIELKKGKNDNIYGVFTLAVGRKENKEVTDFIDCIAFGKLAETISKYTEKGNRLIVTGALHLDSYKDKDGKNRNTVLIIVDDFFFVDFKTKKEEKTEQKATNGLSSDDLPF